MKLFVLRWASTHTHGWHWPFGYDHRSSESSSANLRCSIKHGKVGVDVALDTVATAKRGAEKKEQQHEASRPGQHRIFRFRPIVAALSVASLGVLATKVVHQGGGLPLPSQANEAAAAAVRSLTGLFVPLQHDEAHGAESVDLGVAPEAPQEPRDQVSSGDGFVFDSEGDKIVRAAADRSAFRRVAAAALVQLRDAFFSVTPTRSDPEEDNVDPRKDKIKPISSKAGVEASPGRALELSGDDDKDEAPEPRGKGDKAAQEHDEKTAEDGLGSSKIAGSLRRLLGLTATLYVAGRNSYGQFGDGSALVTYRTPIEISPLPFDPADIKQIEAGSAHTLILLHSGAAFASGYGYYGQLCTNSTDDERSFVPITGLPYAVEKVAAGYHHSLFVLKDFTGVYGCGRNSPNGQILSPASADVLVPTLVGGSVTGFENIIDAAAGFAHSVYLTASGKVFAAGQSDLGQTGLGITSNQEGPAPITSMENITITQVTAGSSHTAFLDDMGKVYTTGWGARGQLGNGGTSDELEPVQVLSSVEKVQCAAYSTLFLMQNNTVKSVGHNQFGTLGAGLPTGQSYTTFQNVELNDDVEDVFCSGVSQTCFFKTTEGKSWGVGRNKDGQLGLGDTSSRNAPVELTSFSNIIQQFGIGPSHTHFLETSAQTQADGAEIKWDNDYLNATLAIEDGITNEVVLFFLISKGRNATARAFAAGCEALADPKVVSVIHTTMPFTETHDLLKVELDINKTAVTSSSLWTGTASSGNVTVCARTDLMNGPISVSFEEVDLIMLLDLEDNIFSLNGGAALQADVRETETAEVANDYVVDVFQCRGGTDRDPLDPNPPLEQNSELELCLLSNSTDVRISAFFMDMIQGGYVYSPVSIENGIPEANADGLTKLQAFTNAASKKKGWKVTTFVISKFFDEGSTINVTGAATLILDDGAQRRVRARLLLSEAAQVDLNYEIALSKGLDSDYDPNAYHSADDFGEQSSGSGHGASSVGLVLTSVASVFALIASLVGL